MTSSIFKARTPSNFCIKFPARSASMTRSFLIASLCACYTGPSQADIIPPLVDLSGTSGNLNGYKICQIDNLKFTGQLASAILAYPTASQLYYFNATNSSENPGRCAKTEAGPWVPVNFTSHLTMEQMQPCSAEASNEYVLNGSLSVSGGPNTSTPVKMKIRFLPLVGLTKYVAVQMDLKTGHKSDLFAKAITSSPAISGGIVEWQTSVSAPANSGPLTGVGCTRPSISQLNLTGTLQVPDADDDLPVDTGAEGILDEPAFDPDEAVDEQEAEAFASLLLNMPELPLLPSVAVDGLVVTYNVQVRYKTISGGYATMNTPAVLGVNTPVLVPNANNSGIAEVVNVKLDPGTPSANPDANDVHYTFVVERASTGSLGCKELPADIKAVADLRGASAGPLYELGYQSIFTGAASEGAPKRFELAYAESQAHSEVTLKTTNSCGTDRMLDIVGRSAEADRSKDLSLRIKMPTAVGRLSLEQGVDDSGRKILAYRAAKPITEIRQEGIKDSRPYLLSLSNIPVTVDTCQHKGNGCNLPWRAGEPSAESNRFSARDASGNYSPITVNSYSTKVINENGALTEKYSSLGNLTFSDLAIESKLDGEKDPIFHSSGYPFYVFFDTRGQLFSGSLANRTFKNGQQTKYTTLNTALPGSLAWNRYVWLKKKWYGFRIKKQGDMGCHEFYFTSSGMLPWLERRLVDRLCTYKY